jgi:hypothetical protein
VSRIFAVSASNHSIAKQLQKTVAGFLGAEVRCVKIEDSPSLDADGLLSFCRHPDEVNEIIPAHWSFATRSPNRSSPCGTLFACPEAIRTSLPVSNEEVNHFGFGLFALSDLRAAMNFISDASSSSGFRSALHKPFWILELELANKWHGRFVRRHSAVISSLLPKVSDLEIRDTLENSTKLLIDDYFDLLKTLSRKDGT